MYGKLTKDCSLYNCLSKYVQYFVSALYLFYKNHCFVLLYIITDFVSIFYLVFLFILLFICPSRDGLYYVIGYGGRASAQ